MERDYEGEMGKYQKELDDAGVEFDITDLCGCTESEIRSTVYNKTNFRCKKCNRITKKIKDKVGKCTDWLCLNCKE